MTDKIKKQNVMFQCLKLQINLHLNENHNQITKRTSDERN